MLLRPVFLVAQYRRLYLPGTEELAVGTVTLLYVSAM